jgi:hypothetical protein
MGWRPWPRVDEKALPCYITPKAGDLFPLGGVNVLDLSSALGGRRLIVKSIYNMLLEIGISYGTMEYHPSSELQIIRSPLQIRKERQGTCLDLAALFCGLCMKNSLLPVLIITKGHAFAAVSLTHGLSDWKSYNRPEYPLFEQEPLRDVQEFRKLIENDSWLAVECTGFARSQGLSKVTGEAPPPESLGRGNEGAMDFDRSVQAGQEQLYYGPRLETFFAIDVAIGHYKWRIDPYPLEIEVNSLPPVLPEKPNRGSMVCKMCDRNTQMNNFLRFFQNKSEELPKRPQVCVLHGSRQEAPESLMEVLQMRLTKYFEEKRGINETSRPPSLEPVAWPDRGGLEIRKEHLKMNLFKFEEKPLKDYSANTLRGIGCFSKCCLVIFSHNIDASAWDEATDIELIRWYIEEYWGSLDVDDNTPQFLIFINIKYEEKVIKGLFDRWFGQRKDINKSILQRLMTIQETLDKNCPFMLIDELTPIERHHLEDWFDENIKQAITPQRRLQYIDEIFPEGIRHVPMALVIEKLNNIMIEARH